MVGMVTSFFKVVTYNVDYWGKIVVRIRRVLLGWFHHGLELTFLFIDCTVHIELFEHHRTNTSVSIWPNVALGGVSTRLPRINFFRSKHNIAQPATAFADRHGHRVDGRCVASATTCSSLEET